MSEEKFTQGEWDYFISDNGDGFPIIFVGDIDIAEIYLPKGNSEEMFANANLIKTAPKMYEKLQEIHDNLIAFVNDCYYKNYDDMGEFWERKAKDIECLLKQLEVKDE